MQYVSGHVKADQSLVPPTPTPGERRGQSSRRPALKMRRSCGRGEELFATKGYEATTVDEIAATAGSPAHLLPPLPLKEEAIFPNHDDTWCAAEAGPARAPPLEHPLDTVCRGIKEVMKMYARRPTVAVAATS